MSTDTAYRVTETRSVKVEPKQDRGSRFWNWIKARGAEIKARLVRMKNAVLRFGRKAGSDMKVAVGTVILWTKQGARYLGSKIYWGGAAVGRFAGRSARFFGRSALTLVRATPQFLARTAGWLLRGASWMVRTSLESAFLFAVIFYVIFAYLMENSARAHDAYERNIHQRTVKMSRGEHREESEPAVFRAIPAVEIAKETSGAGDVVVEETTTTVTEPVDETDEDEDEDEEWVKPDYVDAWFNKKTLVNYNSTDDEVELFVRSMERIATYNDPIIRAWEKPIVETERGKAMSDNELFRMRSYWEGRMNGFDAFMHARRHGDPVDFESWSDWETHLRNKMLMERAMLERQNADAYEARAMHPQSYQEGFNAQMTFELNREKASGRWANKPKDQPKPKAPAKKASAKKTTAAAGKK